MTDKLAIWISLGSLLVSLGSLASIVSAKIASGAERQAKKARTLGLRTEAIYHLHEAVGALQNDRSVTSSAIQSIRAANNRADPVFNDKVKGDLEHAVQTAERLINQQVQQGGVLTSMSLVECGICPCARLQQAVNDLVGDLQNLIQRMNDDAALR
jgi:K+-sensing histidine kinase KdpD